MFLGDGAVVWAQQRTNRGEDVFRQLPGGTVAYSVSEGQELPETGEFAFDVQANGELAVAYLLQFNDPSQSLLASRQETFAWFSPADPEPHVLPEVSYSAVFGPTPIRFVGNEIVYSRSVSACTPSDANAQLVVTDLQGHVGLIGTSTEGVPDGIPFAFDGTYVAWSTAGPEAPVGLVPRGIFYRSLATDPAPVAPAPQGCTA